MLGGRRAPGTRYGGGPTKRIGFAVITAVDGLDAVDKFRARQEDIRLAVLDLTMPRMDGWQTLAALRELRGDLPVILASGYDEAQVKGDKHPQRPQVFLQKPYGIVELQAALGRALGTGVFRDKKLKRSLSHTVKSAPQRPFYSRR